MTVSPNLRASRVALGAVLIVVGVIFVWWVRHRPAYLLYQAGRELNEGNQSAVVSEYQRLLQKKGLSASDEVRMRKALGTFYVNVFQQSNGISLSIAEESKVENPYLELARREFDRVVSLDPSDAESHYYLGRILWFRHLERYAIEEIVKSREYDPKNPEPLWFLAAAHLERGELSLSRENALQALAIRPDYDQARLILANTYAALGDHEEAFAQFHQLSPQFRSDPDTLAQHAIHLAEQNYWEEAMKAMAEAERLAPDNGRVKIASGRLLLMKNELELASGKFSQSAALMPKNVWPMMWQAVAFSKRGLCDDADRPTQFLVSRMPRWAWSHIANAEKFQCQGQLDRALSSLDEALRLSPELHEATQMKARILLGRQQFKELGELVRPLLDKKQHESMAYQLLAESLFLQKKYSMAQAMAESAVKANQQNAQAFVWLAMARAGLNDLVGANQAISNAISLRPFDEEIQRYTVLINRDLSH